MGFIGSKVQLTQEFTKVVPADDPDYVLFDQTKKQFGEDGNALIIGITSKDLFLEKNIQALQKLSEKTKAREGVTQVLNYTQLFNLSRNDSLEKFDLEPLPLHKNLDTLKNQIQNHPFYKNLIFSKDQQTTLCAVSISDHYLQTHKKHRLIKEIIEDFRTFEKETGIKISIGGLPYVRTYMASKLPRELLLFMILAVIVTAITLFWFYRSFSAVVFPMIVLLITCIWTLGIIVILGYKLTILTALLPPLLVVIGIPNSIYMLSDYHETFRKTHNKEEAIKLMIKKLGVVTLMINANTACGFLTLWFTSVVPLQEFGLAAFWGTMSTYLITIVLLPGLFSILPEPNDRKLKHLDNPKIRQIIEVFVGWVIHKPVKIFIISILFTAISIIGIFKIESVAFMVDDMPTHDSIVSDLHFLEDKFGGVFPLQIIIDTGKKNGLRNYQTLEKIEKLQQKLAEFPELSTSLSVVDALKWSRFAYFNQQEGQYTMPSKEEMVFIRDYSKKAGKNSIVSSLTDSLQQKARIQLQVKDLGSIEMPKFLAKVEKTAQEIFPKDGKIKLVYTGTTPLFLKANDYLVNNLFWSLVATFIIIGIQMFVLFMSFRIMTISLLPNLVPLCVTAGLMGFAGVPLKPSTALIYGIAFGIAIDNSIHLLAAYWAERKKGHDKRTAVEASLRHTGMSILYTSVVLFAGFVIFAPSAFGSTRALGLLTSLTLFVALFSNILLLPALVAKFDSDHSREELDAGWINDELEIEAEIENPEENEK